MMDVNAHKKRLQVMLLIVGMAFVVALAMIYMSLRTHSILAIVGLVAAVAVGFGAQGWMILSWKKAEAQQAGGKA